MDHILTKLYQNPVVCVKGNNASNLLHKITEVISNADSSTIFGYICSQHKKNILKHFLPAQIKLYSHHEAIDYLIENKKFASIIYLDNIENYTLDDYLVMSFWAKNYNSNSKINSRLILFCNGQEVIDTPFMLEHKYLVQNNQVPIEYYTANFTNKDKYKLNENIEYIVRKKHEENPIQRKEKSTYVVYVDSDQECNKLYYILRTLENATVYMINSKTDTHILKRINCNKEGRRSIIVTNLTELHFSNVKGVFDSMYTCVKQEDSSNNKQIESTLSTQTMCTKKAHFNNNGFCVRMCKEDFYNKLYQTNISEVTKFNWYKTFLLLYRNKIKADEIFDGASNFEKIGNTNEYLCNMDLIYINGNNFTLTTKGTFVQNFKHLNVKNSTFLKLWMEQKLPAFPGLVAACILQNYNYYYNKQPNKFLHLLETCNKYFESSKMLDLSNLKDFCKTHNINKQHFELLIQNIIDAVLYIKDHEHLELGLYNSKNVYTKSKQLLRKVYYQDIVSVDDKVNKTYKDVNGIENVFSKQILENDFSYPKKLICMKRKKNLQKNMYVMLEYIIL